MKIFIFLISLLYVSTLFGSDSEWKELILKKMLHSISKSKTISIYSNDKSLTNEFKNSNSIEIVKTCNKCDFILAKEGVATSCKKPMIVFSYYKYLHTPNAVGVFFWQKGRPTIRFSVKRLKYFGLNVKGELSKFVSKND
ncbi:hypothetical protein [Sulfurimonas sp.]